MREPFLFRFKEKCKSPSRVGMDASYVYDHDLDMVVDQGIVPVTPAIESARTPGPPTKKRDMEKGEDQKDRRMWQ
jgi:hypothetical protein